MQKEFSPDLIASFKTGSVQALARLLTVIENQPEYCRQILSELYPITHQPLVIGFTGAPGVGKSTLINQLLYYYRESFTKIAVLATDPSSISSGGAFLGDRERMKQHADDDRIFIRSIATRGKLGGMSHEIFDFLLLLAAFPFELILIETVGTGQTEIDIASAADVTAVVLTPYLGDDLQVLKAGILEIADIFVINKNDLSGSDRLSASLHLIDNRMDRNVIPIIRTQAINGAGVEELAKQILMTHQNLKEAGILQTKKFNRFQLHIKHIIDRRLAANWAVWMDELYESYPQHYANPYACADKVERKMSTWNDRKN